MGSVTLRQRIADLHSSNNVSLKADDVVITTGSILANYLALSTILGSGDHIICQYPTYGQLYGVPKHLGVEVSFWKSAAEKNWMPDLGELASLVKPNTKAIIITLVALCCIKLLETTDTNFCSNPCNPSGTVLPQSMLDGIVAVAKQHDLIIFSDEVFRPLFHSRDAEQPPSAAAMGYKKVICTGSVSKAHGLPGIRIGWVVCPDPKIIQQIIVARDYTTISVSQLDQGVASFALSPEVLPRLLDKNLQRCAKGIELLDAFVRQNSKWCTWVSPAGAGVGFIRIRDNDGNPIDDADFCSRLANEHGICVVPGGLAFTGDDNGDDLKGYVRIVLGDWQDLQEGLPVVAQFLARYMGAKV